MVFVAITEEILSSDDPGKGYSIFFSPAPRNVQYPTVWLDIHIGGDSYQDTADEHLHRSFSPPDATGRRCIRIKPKRSVRLFTEERIGLDCKHIGIVMNVASRAKHGLILASGKIDPGFAPNRLVLVVFNQSSRSILLHAGDKVASVAFARVNAVCSPTTSRGHANGGLTDFDPSRRQRIHNWLSTCDYQGIGYDIAKMSIAAALALLGAWLAGFLSVNGQ